MVRVSGSMTTRNPLPRPSIRLGRLAVCPDTPILPGADDTLPVNRTPRAMTGSPA